MFNVVLDLIAKFLEILAATPAAATMAGVGLLLLLLAAILTYRTTKSHPDETPTWVIILLFCSLATGIVFFAVGPGVALLKAENPSPMMTNKKAFDNLEKNARVEWLVRLIPFDPQSPQPLAIGQIKRLGPPDQDYTFVAPYEELIGNSVADAVRMVGLGTIPEGYRVSAIIFRVRDQIYPANARGLVQVIREIESGPGRSIQKPLLGKADLQELQKDLDVKTQLDSWAWQHYQRNYRRYCDLAQKFRCEQAQPYTASRYLGKISDDWHPFGLAKLNPEGNPCSSETKVCQITDWHAERAALLPNFGSRVFLVKNVPIDGLPDRVLIEFGVPKKQTMPDIRARAERQRAG